MCQCQPGYIGQYCETPVCFPQCINGGNCTAPSVCTCPDGYQGIKCEGGKLFFSFPQFIKKKLIICLQVCVLKNV